MRQGKGDKLRREALAAVANDDADAGPSPFDFGGVDQGSALARQGSLKGRCLGGQLPDLLLELLLAESLYVAVARPS